MLSELAVLLLHPGLRQLPQVPPSAPPVLPTLRVLHLGSNLISALPDGCFSACPALTELYLDNNTIRSLSDHTFSGLSSLEVGLLATKHLGPQRSSLIGSPHFQILDLSSNHIQLLPELLLHPLSSIETLYLEGNQVRGCWSGCLGCDRLLLERVCVVRSR